MAGTGDRAQLPVVLKVIPAIPQVQADRDVLDRHLAAMGCHGLLSVAWGVKAENLVEELLNGADNRFHGTIRARPEKWGVRQWQETYGLRTGAVKVAVRRDELLEGEFSGAANPKDGYSLEDLRDPEARLVVGFLNPIFHPEKPKRIISKMAATFLGAMRMKITVDWATLVHEQIGRMVKGLRKVKKAGTPLPTYLIHLYHHFELLTPKEQDLYEDLLNIQLYGGPETDEDEEQEVSEAQPDPSSGNPRPRKRGRSASSEPEPETTQPSQPRQPPHTTEEAAGPSQVRPEISGLTGAYDTDILYCLDQAAYRTRAMGQDYREALSFLTEVMQVLNAPSVLSIIPQIKDLQSQVIQLQVMQEQLAMGHRTHEILRKQLEEKDRELQLAVELRKEAEERAQGSALALVEVRKNLDFPVDTVNRSLLFTAQLEKEGCTNRGQIIRFLMEHSRKMETTWKLMQGLVANMKPEGPEERATQAPEDLATPVRVVTTPEPAAPAEAVAGGEEAPAPTMATPALLSPLTWANMPPLSTGTLRTWKDMVPGSASPATPAPFRLPSASPPGIRRKSTSPISRRLAEELGSPTVSFREMLTRVQEAGTPTASSPTASRGTEAGPTPDTAKGGKASTSSPRRRSARLKHVVDSP